ncbi:GDP-mannose mannosyl hydrolase [Cupriavidus respiraculi]|uniref:GDP-mannose mannosyl hydrolase n=1 Tax=Cupriavidus respiraculi TaxID=195930 RepID=A0ABM8X368_9BURK|nr:GDP-mannose mannosyl hydrolase [Cupriavidus respiraculi]
MTAMSAEPAARPAHPSPAHLPPETFRTVVASTPLVAIDLLVRDGDGRYLVGRRRNPPARGSWFVPGGRIRKDERLAQALQRLCEEELGGGTRVGAAVFRGAYEHFYDINFAGEEGASTHYVVLAYEMALEQATAALPEAQHGAYRWMAPAELLADPEVHANTRAYFER